VIVSLKAIRLKLNIYNFFAQSHNYVPKQLTALVEAGAKTGLAVSH
jgi:hypothetical protein